MGNTGKKPPCHRRANFLSASLVSKVSIVWKEQTTVIGDLSGKNFKTYLEKSAAMQQIHIQHSYPALH